MTKIEINIPKGIKVTPELKRRIQLAALPEIAENGNQVKVSFEIDSHMTDKDYVKTVYILADGNPAPNVAKFNFTPALGSCSATTRIRLSKTQNVHLLAAYNNGKFAMTKSKVKVTIGGCGG